MKAVLYEKYGGADVLEFKNIEKPIPRNSEVLIKVYATSVTAGDWRMRKADPFLARLYNGLFRPKKVKILGFELAGVIEDTGRDVNSFKKGDAVFASCGIKFGAYAEYRCLPEDGLIAEKPSNMTFEEAATVPIGCLTALILLRKGEIGEGKKVLIYGASGSVGTFAIQLAKHFGADVTAVCSGKNIELVRSVGADKAIDYNRDDFTRINEGFDIILDAVGKIKKSICKGILGPEGKYVSVLGQAKPVTEDLLFIKNLIAAGALTSVIDRIYEFEEIREAHRYVEQFHKRGNVAIRIVKDQ
jgi:NADPH:quinone reductase-like Zn-dependent oxidoreductase